LKKTVGTMHDATAHYAGDAPVAPLHKHRPSGDLYQRDSRIEALIAELTVLSRDEFLARAAVTKRADPDYIPSECLVYFVRACRSDKGDAWFEHIYRILSTRVLCSLPKAEGVGGTESLTRGTVRDEVFGRFTALLAEDRHTYADKLDMFEVRFDFALKRLRIDAQKKAWRNQNRSQPLEIDEDSGEPSVAIEAAARNYAPWDAPESDDPDYRSRLDAAIDALPPEQTRIIHMLKDGFPIDSQEPDAMTIAKALNRSEKTIRTYRDKAFAALRAALTDGECR